MSGGDDENRMPLDAAWEKQMQETIEFRKQLEAIFSSHQIRRDAEGNLRCELCNQGEAELRAGSCVTPMASPEDQSTFSDEKGRPEPPFRSTTNML